MATGAMSKELMMQHPNRHTEIFRLGNKRCSEDISLCADREAEPLGSWTGRIRSLHKFSETMARKL